MPKIRSPKNSNLIPAGEPQFYSVAGLAKDLGKHRRTVHSWIVRGRIKAIQVGEVFAIPAKEAARIKKELTAA
jgi:excisionase family DNA binding protein